MAYPFEGAIVSTLVQIIKSLPNKQGDDCVIIPKEGEKWVWKGYKPACTHAEEMGVHLSGIKPETLLRRVRPREDPLITQYRLESYEPTTVSTLGKALAITGKIFNPKLYGIKAAENTKGKELYEYAVVNYPFFNSVVNFLASYALKRDLEDPNGIFIAEPGELPLIEDGTAIDPTKQLNPVMGIYRCSDIWLTTSEYILLFLKKGEDGQKKYWVFKYVDKVAIYEFELYTVNSQQYQIDLSYEYLHGFGELPVWKMGGEFDDKNPGLYKSFFYPSVPFLNKAITAESDLDGAFVNHLHPIRWEVAEECEFVDRTGDGEFPCQNGLISSPGGQRICPNCRGTGRKSVQSPHQIYQVSKDKLSDPNARNYDTAPTGFIDVPTKATELLDQRVDKLHEKALSAINMDIVNEIGSNQSGEAKAYDRSELNNFLNKVRDLFYDVHLPNIFYFFGKYMFLNISPEELDKIEPTIIKPVEYDILSTSEMTEQLKVGKDSGINASYQDAKQLDIQNKDFQNHPEVLMFLNLALLLDPCSQANSSDLDLAVARGTISKNRAIIHDNIQEFIRRALEEDPKFKDKTYIEQMDVLESYADDMQSDIKDEQKIEIDLTAIQPPGNNPNQPPKPGLNDPTAIKPAA